MTDAAFSLALEEFESVEAAPGTTLLRLTARRPHRASAGGAPTLIISHGRRTHRFTPLPAPPDPNGLLRSAYSAPASLLEERCQFSLELSDGAIVELPSPTPRRTRVARPIATARSDASVAPARGPEAGRAELVRERMRRTEAERHAEARREAIAELERRLRSVEDEREQAEQRAAHAADAGAQAAARVAELDSDLEHMRARAAEAEQAQAELSRRLEELDRASHASAAALAQGHTVTTELEARVQGLAAALEQARLAQEATGSELEARVQELAEVRATAEQQRAQAVAAEQWSGELERELTARVDAATEGQAARIEAAKQRQRAEELEATIAAESARVAATRGILGELEQRLATSVGVTGELEASLQAARADAESQRERAESTRRAESELRAQLQTSGATAAQLQSALETAHAERQAAQAEREAIGADLETQRHAAQSTLRAARADAQAHRERAEALTARHASEMKRLSEEHERVGAEHEQRLQELRVELTSAKERTDAVRQRATEFEQRSEAAQAEAITLRQRLHASKAASTELEVEVQAARTEASQHHERVGELERDLTGALGAAARARETTQGAERQAERAAEALGARHAREIKRLAEEHERLNVEHQRHAQELQTALASSTEQIATLQGRAADLETTITAEAERAQTAQRTTTQLQAQLQNDLQAAHAERDAIQADLETQRHDAQSALEAAHADAHAHQERAETLTARHASEIERLAEERQRLSAEHQRRAQELQTALASSTEQIATLQGRAADLETTITAEAGRADTAHRTTTELQAQLEASETTTTQLQNDLQAAHAAREAIQADLETQRHTAQSALEAAQAAAKEGAREQVSALRVQLEKLQAQMGTADDRAAELERELVRSGELVERAELVKHVEELVEELAEVRAVRSDAENALGRLRDELETDRDENRQLDAHATGLILQLTAAQAEAEDARALALELDAARRAADTVRTGTERELKPPRQQGLLLSGTFIASAILGGAGAVALGLRSLAIPIAVVLVELLVRRRIILLVAFIYVGIFKDQGLLQNLPIDPTLFLGSLLVGVCFHRLLIGKVRMPPLGLLCLLGAIGCLLVVSLLWTPAISYGEQKAGKFWTLTVLACLSPFFVIENRRDLRQFAGWTAVVALIAALGVLVHPPTESAGQEGRLVLGSLTGTVLLARLLGTGAFMLLFAAVLEPRRRWRVPLALGGLVVVAVDIGVGSRGPLISFALTLACIGTVSIAGHPRRLLAVLFVAIVSIAALPFIPLPETSIVRIQTAITNPGGSLAQDPRHAIYDQAIEVIGQHPLLGIGSGGFSTYSGVVSQSGFVEMYPHNIFLELWAELSVVAAALLAIAVLYLIVGFVRRAGRSGHDRHIVDMYLGFFLFNLFSAQTSGDINDNRTFWTALGVGWLLTRYDLMGGSATNRSLSRTSGSPERTVEQAGRAGRARSLDGAALTTRGGPVETVEGMHARVYESV